jgi:hypothetical protein
MNTQTRVGVIGATTGNVYVKRETGTMEAAFVGLPIYVNDLVMTLSNSYADVSFDTGGLVAINQSTIIRVDGTRDVTDISSRSLAQQLFIFIGEAYAKITKQQEEEQFQTHGGALGIKG